jgi:hypothetical protein
VTLDRVGGLTDLVRGVEALEHRSKELLGASELRDILRTLVQVVEPSQEFELHAAPHQVVVTAGPFQTS